MRKQKFKSPFIGINEIPDMNGKSLPILFANNGAMSVILKIDNLATEYCANEDYYRFYHSVFGQLVKMLGDGYTVQKTDIITEKKFEDKRKEENKNNDYLTNKYFNFFSGRPFKEITTYLTFTKQPGKKSGGLFSLNSGQTKEFAIKIHKALDTISNNRLSYILLNEREIKRVFNRFEAFDFANDTFSLSNIQSDENGLYFGDLEVKSLSIIDLDEMNLPSELSTYSISQELGTDFPTDNFDFLTKIPAKTVIYNQIIKIPDQRKVKSDLELKKRRHAGMPDPANQLSIQDIDDMFVDIAQNNELLVYCHFNIMVADKSENIEKAINAVENHLFTIGIIPGKNNFNQMELFRSAIPGNAGELKDYDLFLTSRPASICFFFKEALPLSDDSDYQLFFTDRQGIPLGVDTSELAMQTGRISNRNRFILGPSGSGKSFFTNSYLKQCYEMGADVVIVDTGNSYSGLSKYVGGKYITYTEENPITMNPFKITEIENNEEKRQMVKELIGLIWKGADGHLTQVEDDVISKCVAHYYMDYFKKGREITKTEDELTVSELEALLAEKNIECDEIYDKAVFNTSTSKDDVLRKKFQIISKLAHPDFVDEINKEQANEIFTKTKKAFEAGNISEIDEWVDYLLNENPFKINGIKKEKKKNKNIEAAKTLDDEYKNLLYKTIINIYNRKVTSLSFNTFYEFSCEIIEKIINNERITFDLDEYKFILKKFYRGGIYDTILNDEFDSTLFDEKFIVFEIDNIKEHKLLFPITTLIIMDVFIQKMRHKSNKKILTIEEAWKAIASPMMAGYILYLYKTCRKFGGEAIVVTQELNDIIGNEIVKDSILSNSDTICLLDQTKFKDTFNDIAKLLALNEVEQRKIFTINKLDNKRERNKFKEVYIKRGSIGEVYGVEVTLQEYLTYTTERSEKEALEIYFNHYGSYQVAMDTFIEDMKESKLSLPRFVRKINSLNEVYCQKDKLELIQ